MHGCSSGSGLLVNAEVDSMGGVVDGGVGVGLKTSPRRAAIERAQAALRQEYDVREERRRELEFLEKGGNPLDFKFGNAASVSVQSTSLTDQHPEQIVTSEAKGSFALAASPHGDSVESSGRPGVPAVCEPNSADNLLLFDGENELLEAERSSIQPSRRNNIAPSEQSSQMDGSQNAKESEDSAIVRPYARRNRSRHPIRDGARGRDGKGMMSETNNAKDQNIPSVSNPKSASSNGDLVSKIVSSDNQLDTDLDGVRALGTPGRSLPEGKLDIKAPKNLRDNQHDQPSQVSSQQTTIDMASGVPDLVGERHQVVSAGFEHSPCATTTKDENETSSGQLNGFSSIKIDRKSILNEGQNSNAALGTKGLDPECSSTQASLGLDVNNDSDMCTNTRKVVSNGNTMEQTSNFEETINLAGCEVVKEKNESNSVDKKNDTKAIDKTSETKAVDSGPIIDACHDSVYQNHSGNGSVVEVEEDMHLNRSELQNEVKYPSNVEGVQQNEHTASETEGKVDDVLVDNSNPSKENIGTGGLQERMDISNRELPGAALSGMDASAAPEPQTCSGNSLKLADKAHEDSILEEARIIEAKRKRIAELSVRTLYLEHRRKSQWDFVLEEMAWLANDFAQERLWKINAAAQICYRAAFTSRLRFEQQNQFCELKRVAHTLAKAVTQFWSSAEVLLNRDDPNVSQKNCKYSLVGSRSADGNEVSKDKIGESDMERSQELGTQYPRKNPATAVLGYAVRFLKYNSSVGPLQAEAPSTPDRISDLGTVEMSWEDHLTEETLFYSVPSGATEIYRKSIESHLLQSEKTGSSMQEEVDTSTYDAVADYGYEENAYDEDEGETSTFSLPGAFEGSKSSKFAQKKRKILMKSYTSRSYEVGADMPYCTTGNQQSMMIGKRPASLNVGSIPTKRMRTATRQRVLSPFSTGATGNMQAQVKTDASSGDTNSCQDDQSTLHGGSQIQKSVEVESVGDFEKQLPYDCAETSIKLKKKKKAKHLGSTYELGWQMDSSILNEQRDHSKKRMEGHHFESNGTSGLYGQPNAKKPKILKQSLDNTFDNITPMSGSIPSPVASQMSNMPNPNKFIKLIGGRDRGRKVKALKMSPGQSGSGSPWSLFEDQALVVLVHDMGPNWELVSDVINSTLQFKCIFRKPKECKERHKLLMDRNAGDGADSAEDSGSSQSYPSTLPGIPKGSARQLFQRLQGPMEEDTIKAHFEKIIMIGQKQHYRRSQSDNQDLKQTGAVHNSHAVAISQVCPNLLNGGVLTPLDLCDAITSSPDHPLGYQGSHPSGLAISNQSAVAAVLPTSGANSALQGSSGVVHSSNLSSPSAPLNASVRDGRYNVPRTSSLPVDEQQRLQQYNQMLSGRNIQQSSMSVPGALSGADRGVRMLPGGNGMGMMCGMNRSMPISRPGFPGVASSSMLNSGTMHSSGMGGMPSPVTMHSGPGSGQVNSMLRPRDTLHMMRPVHNPEHQRQMMVPELQMQGTQGNSQVMPHFNGLSSAFSNQTTSPPVQPYAGHSQQQHQMSPQQSHALSHHPHIQGPSHGTGSQHQAYAIRIAKDRQQRYLQQQQQQQQQPPFAASNALMTHVQPQPQLPISSSLQNSSQIQSQISSQPVSLTPVTSSSPMTPLSSQHQQKHQLPQHGLSRNPGASGLTNQMGKQRQRQQQQQQQQFQQSGRHHPQQRQQAQSQQQAKLLKGIGRGNMLVQQNLPIDPSHLNGLSMPPGSQAPEKGEQIMHVMQGQGVYSGSGLNPVQPSKPLVPSQSSNHSQLQQKLHPAPAPPSSKQLQQMPTHSDNSTQGQSPLVPSGHMLSSSHQTISSANVASNHQQMQLQPQPQPHQKQVNQTQSSVQRMLQQNRQVNSELQNKSQTDLAQADQQAVNNASQVICSTAMPQACIDSADVVPVVSSGTASPWKASEPAYDSNLPDLATQVSSVGSPPIPNPAGSEPLPPISPGLGPRQLSGSFPPHGHNVGAQWQPQLPPQQPPTPPPPSQQQYQPQEQQKQEQQSPQHIQPQQQSHQQTQLLQAGQGSLYMRPTSSKLE
ncbi:chromatin modification-related protein EAF1 B-like isoform X2 [Corylus avellana]|uniref:chromatin modification-related protein EAF1 B-like isoform X2 n=1 Tax=Corylus avellana TaxID=13451 RepID=UPI00286AA257|nr:chromatin modification-related protein EAF1 B-like isoform X2 [Corylus avellana]